MIPLPVVDVLDSISIPVPCPVSWESMHGDHRTRFCDKCSQNVHDVSELTREEAAKLVTGSESTPCLRLFRRPDGRVMTADCLTRRERAWKWLHRRSAWAAALFALVFMGCHPAHTPGKPCMGDPIGPVYTETKEQDHVAEQVSRQSTAPEQVQQVNQTKPEAMAEAAVRHENDSVR